MLMVRSSSSQPPFDRPDVARRAARALGLADAMGLVPDDLVIRRLDTETFRRAMDHVLAAGIGRGAILELAAVGPDGHERLARLLDEITSDLEASPVPEAEWKELERTLGLEGLARLVGVSGSSARRYRAARRRIPDDVAERLHFLAGVVGHLRGAYNDRGVVRWFRRPRTLLDGRAPAELLSRGWGSNDDGPRRVGRLARSLAGSPAT